MNDGSGMTVFYLDIAHLEVLSGEWLDISGTTFSPLLRREHAVVIQDVVQVLLLVVVYEVVDRLISEISL